MTVIGQRLVKFHKINLFITGQSAKVEVKHVFISYHAENRDTILRISDRLTENGYKVWLEKSNGESYSRHLTEAVENAAVVVIAISRKYKQSPSVFAGLFCCNIFFFVKPFCIFFIKFS